MKKIIILIALIAVALIPNLVYASTSTIPRTEDNLGVADDINVTSSNKQDILDTPKVDEKEKVYDFADLLTEKEEEILYKKIESAIKETNLDIIVVTIDDNNKANATKYADDFFAYNDFGISTKHSGILLLIDMDTRNLMVITSGDGILLIDKQREEAIYDYIAADATNEEYLNAATKFVEKVKDYKVKDYNDSGIPSSNKEYYIDENGNYLKRKSINWVISIVGSLVISGIVIWIMISKHKMIRPAKYANEYINKDSTRMYAPIDRFLSTNTITTKIPRSNGGSGGGSSIRSHSSGRSFGGGGGRRF